MPEAAKTITSCHDAFAEPTDLTTFVDWRLLADLMPDDDTPLADRAAVEAHSNTLFFLKTASGMIEVAIYRGGRYTRADLRALIGVVDDDDGDGYVVSGFMLREMTCRLALYLAVIRRKPDVNPLSIAGVQTAFSVLEALRLGERVFPMAEAQQAGVMGTAVLDSTKVNGVDNRITPISSAADRLFGNRLKDSY